MEDMTTWPARELQMAIRRGGMMGIHYRQGGCPMTPELQKVIDLGDAAEKELQRREALEGVFYERLT